jgi:hypothetical protein
VRRCVLVWLLAMAAVVAAPRGARREGRDWVATESGRVPSAGSRLRLLTKGSVRLQGENIAGVAYTIRKRVGAMNQAEAERLLGEFRVMAQKQAGGTRIVVWMPDGDGASAEMTVRVPRRLRESVLESQDGTIEAYDLDGEVVADTAGGRIHLDRIWGGATARTGGGEIVLGRVNRTVKCSSAGGSIQAGSLGGDSWLETAGGEISVQEAAGTVHASTGGGNIRVGRAAAGVLAQTAGGSIQVWNAGGPVTAETSGGGIAVSSARGVRCESAAGPITLHRVQGALRVSTAMGSVYAELLRGARLEDSFLTSGRGDVTVFIPSNLAVTIRAENESGGNSQIVSDFPEIRIRREAFRWPRLALAEGVLNGGGPVLRVATSGGTIYLRRQK